MLRNLSFVPRQLNSNSRRFFSHAALPNPGFLWAQRQILNTPQNCRIESVQFDVAGTILDANCIGPFAPFRKVFFNRGFDLTEKQILGPMGMSKIKHIEHLLNEIKGEFYKKQRREPDQTDVQEIYKEFMLLLPASVKQRTELTLGTEEAVNFILQNKMKLSLTSGYPRDIADIALINFKKKFPGYESTTSNEVAGGTRIEMIKHNNKKLGKISRTIFFTDAPNDIVNVREDGSIWVIGVSGGSVCMNITSVEVEKNVSEAELQLKRQMARCELEKYKPHAVIEHMGELPFVIAAVCKAIHKGLEPKSTKKIRVDFPEVTCQQENSIKPRG